jgi:hypothetical protein
MTLLLIMLIKGMLVSRISMGVVVAALLFSTFVSSCCGKLAFLAWAFLQWKSGWGKLPYSMGC